MTKIAVVALVTLFARILVSLNSYSGEGKPPMFGDFEAQRHWMEITYNLPAEDWYMNSTKNDLLYWGLDYPPLTAYHSYILGAISHRINGSWVELFTSRGLQDSLHKLFMRYTVLASDVLVYIPAVFIYFLCCINQQDRNLSLLYCLLALMYPGLILIDHGHFQYNNVSLGLTLWAVIGLVKGFDLLGSISFVLALNYKQMELYHAMPFFCYLLGRCWFGKENFFIKLTKIGLVVLATFVVCWLPFIKSKDVFFQVLNRLFPFARGLYEDKVANVWCSLSVVIKLKLLFDQATLVKICLMTTLTALLPSSIHLLLHPSVNKFKYALVNASLIFFLFSFQVHEKSILMPAFMLPLLVKDGQLIPYWAFMGMFHVLYTIVSSYLCDIQKEKCSKRLSTEILFMVSLSGVVVLGVCSVLLAPPPHLPDLFPVLISTYSCVHFLLFLLYFHYLQFTTKEVPHLCSSKTNIVKERKFHKTKKIN